MKKNFDYLIENSIREQVLNEAPTYFDNGQQGVKDLLGGIIKVTLENAFLPEIASVRKIESPSGVFYGLGTEQQTGPKRIIGVGSETGDTNYSLKGVATNLTLDYSAAITPVTVDDGAGANTTFSVAYTGVDDLTKTISGVFVKVAAGTGANVYTNTKATLVALGYTYSGIVLNGLVITYDDTNLIITFAVSKPGKVSVIASYGATDVSNINKANYGVLTYTSYDGTEIVNVTPKLIGRAYQVKSKKMKVELTKELIDDFTAVTKEESVPELSAVVGSLLNYEIEQDVIDKIKNATNIHTDTIAWRDWTTMQYINNPANELYTTIIKMLTTIGSAARCGIGNFIVIPPKFMQAVILMEKFEGEITEYYSVIQKIGIINKFIKVFINPVETEDKIICGFTPSEGSKFMPGLIFAPYSFNVYSATDVSNLNLNQGIFARYALEFLESKTITGTSDYAGQKQYGVITVTGAGTDLF
ncbi:MAG: hypothetical protein WC755_07885 [Candidatus Woesearchaeota archaeon]